MITTERYVHPEEYNQRLFRHNLRGLLHRQRFRWLVDSLARHEWTPERVIELGCYDAKTLDFLPKRPAFYVGLDANWERGLELARGRYGDDPSCRFIECTEPEQIPPFGVGFDTAICMETLEHVDPKDVDGYLAALASRLRGYLFASVPVERHLTFALKRVAKRALLMHCQPYTWAEFWAAVTGRMDRVAREEHKGFDDRALVTQIARYFEVLSVEGIAPGFGPLGMNFQVGVVARTTASAPPKPQPT